MNYPSWQGPALSGTDRKAYQDYCQWCENVWGAQPPSIEKWLQDTKMISSSPSPYLAERGVSLVNKA